MGLSKCWYRICRWKFHCNIQNINILIESLDSEIIQQLMIYSIICIHTLFFTTYKLFANDFMEYHDNRMLLTKNWSLVRLDVIANNWFHVVSSIFWLPKNLMMECSMCHYPQHFCMTCSMQHWKSSLLLMPLAPFHPSTNNEVKTVNTSHAAWTQRSLVPELLRASNKI